LYNDDKSIVLICNGEIFNYLELKRDLKKLGYSFKTNVDVEVIIPLYQEYGVDFINKLNGQFSFALLDLRKNLILCARDHVGINPFYYSVVDGAFIFGSEIKAILAHPGSKPELNLIGLDQTFTFPGLVSPQTMFKNIHSLKSGHYITIQDGRVKEKEYWDLDFPCADDIEYKFSESYYAEKLEELLSRAIDIRLRADVPIGFYLSGGLDSSLIASMASSLTPGKRYHSFSIDFTDRNFSEKQFQNLVVEQLGTNHHEVVFGSRSIEKYLAKAIYHSECPLKETYNTASLALSELVQKNNLKVILSGEGADELFAGYVGYRLDATRDVKQEFDLQSFNENGVREKLWGDENFFYERDFIAFNDVKKSLYSAALVEAFDTFDCLNHFVVDRNKIHDRHILHKRSYCDFKLRLSDHLVSDHCDRMTMAHSVEGRYPFLDKEFIDFVTKIPPNYILKDMEEKYILKKMADKWVPKTITKREKFSFVSPGSDYLLKQNVEWINDLLSTETIKRQNYFNPATVELLKQQYKRDNFSLNLPFDNDLLIIVLCTSIFLEQFDIPALR
jgi:asparagine synthase (glutamine-hydrolysing)